MNHYLFVTPLLFLLGSCQAIHITRVNVLPKGSQGDVENAKELDGIPFYAKKLGCKHEVVWLEPVYTLTLEEVNLDASGKEQVSANRGSGSLSLSQYRNETRGVFQALAVGNDVLGPWRTLLSGTQPHVPAGFPRGDDRILVSNLNSPTLYVDNSVQYFLNVHQPLAGSAKLSWKLAADGTLTEGTAEVEEKTLETVLSNVKDMVSSGITPTKQTLLTSSAPLQQFKLTVTVSAYKHTLSQIDREGMTPCGVLPPAPSTEPGTGFNIDQWTYAREYIAGSASDDKEEDDKPIKVSGQIVLPKENEAAGDSIQEKR